MDERTASAIQLCLAKNILMNVGKFSSTKELCERLEKLYQTKSITEISDHLSVLNDIVTKLEVIGVKIEDKDKTFRLLWSLPTSYKYLLATLIYGKQIVDLEEVASTIFSKEKRLSGRSNEDSDNLALTVGIWKKNNSKKKQVYWVCGQ